MSIIAPLQDELFTIRLTSYSETNPSQKWSNNYCFEAVSGGDFTNLQDVALALLIFQRNLTYTNIVTERAIVSTFVADSSPYNGNEFLSVEFNLNGSLSNAVSSILPLEACLYMRKRTITGRSGKTFLRGALIEGEVEFGQSLFALTDPGAINDRIQTAVTSSGLSSFIGSNVLGGVLVIPPTGVQSLGARDIQAFEPSGVRFVNMNKRYYDR